MATNPQNLTVDEMGLRAEQQMRDRTIAQAMSNPNTLVTGGSTPAGQFQAMTQQNLAQSEGQAWLAEQAKREQQDREATANRAKSQQDIINSSFANDPRALNVQQNTIGSLYGASSSSALDAYGRRLSELSKPVDEEKIRQDAINRVQSEIDAMNRFYAEKTRQEQGEARQVGESRLGQNAAINARRGMIGSDFGAARTSTIEQANAKVQNDIWELNNARRLAEQAAIMGRANTAADAEIAKKEAQLNESLQAAVRLQESQRQRAEKAADTRIAGLIAQGIKPSEADYDALAAQFGIDKETLRAKYAMSQPGAEKPIVVDGVLYQKQADGSYKPLTPGKAAADQALMEVSPGASLYDPATGKFIGTAPGQASGPRFENVGGVLYRVNSDNTVEAVTERSTGLTDPQKISTFNSIVNNFSRSPLIAARDRTPVLARSIEEIKNNPSDPALQMNLAYSYIQALDTYQSAVREGELGNLNSIDSKIGQLQNWVTQIGQGQTVRPEVAQQIANAAGIIVDTIKNAADQKTRMYESQARVAGVGPQWNEFITGAYGAPPVSTTPPVAQSVRVQDVENVVGMSLSAEKRAAVEDAIREFPSATPEQVAQALGFNSVGGDTKPAVPVSVDSRVEKLAKAIAQHETGNRNIAGATGELPTRYQFMPATWKTLAKKHLGDANAPTTDENQDKVAKAEIADLFRQGYDERQIAMIWNGGVPRRKVGTTKTTSGKTINYDTGRYADKVLSIYKNS